MDADGGILVQYEAMMSFLKRNLRSVQVEPGFNTLGQLEAPIRLFIFDNRVEIHSPGALPGGLQVEDVMTGTSLPRNKTLFTHGAYLLPYSGIGRGFLRVRELDDKVEVVNDTKKKEVIVTFWRESNQENKLSGKIKDIVNFCTVPRTAQEIMTLLRRCDSTMTKWARRGYLVPSMVGGKHLYRKADLMRILNGGRM